MLRLEMERLCSGVLENVTCRRRKETETWPIQMSPLRAGKHFAGPMNPRR